MGTVHETLQGRDFHLHTCKLHLTVKPTFFHILSSHVSLIWEGMCLWLSCAFSGSNLFSAIVFIMIRRKKEKKSANSRIQDPKPGFSRKAKLPTLPKFLLQLPVYPCHLIVVLPEGWVHYLSPILKCRQPPYMVEARARRLECAERLD